MEAILLFAVITFANIAGVTAVVDSHPAFNEEQPQGQVEVLEAQAASTVPGSSTASISAVAVQKRAQKG